MSDSSVNSSEMKLLPGTDALPPVVREPTVAVISGSSAPSRQLSELPRDELNHLAKGSPLDPPLLKPRQHPGAAIHDRRQLIAAMDRDAMLDVIRWGRRP